MKICYLYYDGIPTITKAVNSASGGLNTILYNLINNIAQIPEISIDVITACNDKNFKEKRRQANITDIGLFTKEPNVLDFSSEFANYLLQNKISIIHTAGSESGYIMSILRKEMGLVLPWIHTNFATLGVRQYMLNEGFVNEYDSETIRKEKDCLVLCDHIIALSETDKLEIAKVFKINLGKISVVCPGVDKSIFYCDRDQERENIIISAGRLSKIKDFPYVLRVFEKVLKESRTNDLKLFIVGGNQCERESLGLIRLADKLKIVDNVMFIDGVTHYELAKYFRKAKVFVGISLHETFGLLPVEARSCGLPFVVRANSSYLDTAQNGRGGYFVDNYDQKDMVKKIIRLLELTEKDWRQFSVEAVNSTNKFNWKHTATSTLDIYKQTLLKTD